MYDTEIIAAVTYFKVFLTIQVTKKYMSSYKMHLFCSFQAQFVLSLLYFMEAYFIYDIIEWMELKKIKRLKCLEAWVEWVVGKCEARSGWWLLTDNVLVHICDILLIQASPDQWRIKHKYADVENYSSALRMMLYNWDFYEYSAQQWPS